MLTCLLYTSDRNSQSVQECLDAPQPFLAVFEGIEDPFNLGYAFRTLYAAGCTGVRMGSRDGQTAQPTIVKSSAGASEQLAWCLCEDLGAAVRQCRQAGCVLYCCLLYTSIQLIPSPLAALRRHFAPYPKPDASRCLGCGECVRDCPVQAITLVDHKAVVNRRRCIRCYCCQEVCPVHVFH